MRNGPADRSRASCEIGRLEMMHRGGFPRIATLAFVLLLSVVALQVVPPPARGAAIDPYMSGLNWPIALGFASDGRIFFAERFTGAIRIIKGGVLLPTAFYVLTNTDSSGERGLLGLALDPGFPSTPYVYAYQTYNDVANSSTYNRIVRITANGDTGVSHIVILRMPPLSSATIHNGGVIAFGPDGKLYAVVGENANPALSQDKLSPMGKVLRMNTDGTAPTDNPFYGDPTWYPLVYTYGHRNMFGLAFHPNTGRPYVTENGPACNDEINLLPNLTSPRRNFGWGPTATCSTPPPPPNNTNQDGPSPVLPIWWWGGTICPTNAAIYGGSYFPAYRGDLFMGDCNFRHFHRLHLVPPNYDTVTSDTIIWTAPDIILDVEQGRDQAIWLTTPSAIYRYHNEPPVATFSVTPGSPLVNQTVTFNGSASYDPNGTITSYAWDFGDSSSGTGKIATHVYSRFGLYNVTLTVVDNDSLSTSWRRQVRVLAMPVADFTFAPSTPLVNTTVSFDASTSFDPDGSIARYGWNFGDNATGSGRTVNHIFVASRAYTVVLTVTDTDGLTATASKPVAVVRPNGPPVAAFTVSPNRVNPGQTVTFNASASRAPGGVIVNYSWDFGDGSIRGSGVLATHSYAAPGTYSVRLSVYDNNGSSGTASSDLRVNAPPHAAFVVSQTQTFIGINLTFNASTSTDPDSPIVAYRWDFGDNSSGSGRLVIHAYAHKGAFTVRLTVRDDLSLANSTALVVRIVNRAPIIVTANPSPGNVTVQIGETVTFRVDAQDPDQDPLSYSWRVDGILMSSSQSFAFVDSRAGTHRVTVDVTDGTAVVARAWDVTVVAPPAGGIEGSTIIGGILIGAGILLVAVILLISRRRRRKHQF